MCLQNLHVSQLKIKQIAVNLNVYMPQRYANFVMITPGYSILLRPDYTQQKAFVLTEFCTVEIYQLRDNRQLNFPASSALHHHQAKCVTVSPTSVHEKRWAF